GSQLRQTPVWPRKWSQVLVTRKGGKARAITARARTTFRKREGRPASQSAAKSPRLAASSAVRLLTSKLFLSRTQFIPTLLGRAAKAAASCAHSIRSREAGRPRPVLVVGVVPSSQKNLV